MKKIAKILPYFLVEKLLISEEKATTCHIKSKDGFKHQVVEGLEVKLWEIFPGTFLCKSEYALLQTKQDNLTKALKNVEEKIALYE